MLNLTNGFEEAEKFLLNLNVGEGYSAGGKDIVVTERTKKKIRMSNGALIHIKEIKDKGVFYLDAKGTTIKQTLRDIDGYLIYRIHSNFNL